MTLTDSGAMAIAWLIVPAAVAIAACGIGLLVARAVGIRLGALTTPTGFLAGLTGMTVALQLGLSGELTVVICVIAAVLGFVVWQLGRRGLSKLERGDRSGRVAALWSAASAVVAWGIGMLPLAGSGRLGFVGYYFNNDAASHMMIVNLLRRGGIGGLSDPSLSTEFVERVYSKGYPLGSHVWPVFATTLTGTRELFVWTPLIALSLGMLALTCFAIMHEFEVPNLFAALVSAAASSSYLLFSYLAQSGMKEVVFASATLTTIALGSLALRQDFAWRASIPVAIGGASMLAVLGIGAGAWLAPAGLAFAVVFALTARRRLAAGTIALRLAVAGGMTLLIALPLLVSAWRWAVDQGAVISSADQIGNLLGPVPWKEALGIWFQPDYRQPAPYTGAEINHLLIALAALLAAFGVAYAAGKRKLTIPLGVLVAALASFYISHRYSIYYQAKTFVVLAPILGLAIGTALAAAWNGGRTLRWASVATGLLLGGAAAASLAMVYAGAWMSPDQRFNEFSALSKRLSGKGNVLVSDREDYARAWLTGNNTFQPWQVSYVVEQVGRDPQAVINPFHTPDLDDYLDTYLAQMDWIVDRRRPGGSRAPGNYALAFRTKHYDVWKRVAKQPAEHLALGEDQPVWTAPLACDSPAVKSFLRRTRGQRVRVALTGGVPVVLHNRERAIVGKFEAGPDLEVISRQGISLALVGRPHLRKGVAYDVFQQGAFSSGVAHRGPQGVTGKVSHDLGTPNSWQPLGSFTATGDDTTVVYGLTQFVWRPGWGRSENVGQTAYMPRAARRALVTTDAAGLRRYCGKRVDWVERF